VRYIPRSNEILGWVAGKSSETVNCCAFLKRGLIGALTVSHVWTVWVVFDRSGVFLKNPPARSVVTIGSNLFVNMQRRPKIRQSWLNLTTRFFVWFPTRNICDSAPPCRSADIPNAATRSPAYDVGSYWSQVDIALVTGTEIG
jgi:hypothetical protein